MMEKWLKRDGWLKALSAVLAIFLWVGVMQDYTRDELRTFQVRLQVHQHPTLQYLEGPQDGDIVEIRVNDKNLAVSRLRAEQFTASIDFRKITEPGKQTQVEVNVTGPPRVNYAVVPKSFPVTLIQIQEARVPVRVEPAQGLVNVDGRDYRFRAAPEQPRAIVSGRSDHLIHVKEGLLTLEPGELVPSNTRLSKQILPLDASGAMVEDLQRTSTDVLITWELLPPARPVQIRPSTQNQPPVGYVVTGIEPLEPTVLMRATTVDGKLPSVDEITSTAIDLTGQTKTFTATARLIAPAGTTLGAETVNVVVNISEVTAEKTLSGVKILVNGKSPEFDVVLQQSEAEVRLRGPYSIVTPLDPTSISVHVDVEGHSEGTYLLPVRVNKPVGITEELVTPSSVEVTITNR
jgi:YbbR domain-containing protein